MALSLVKRSFADWNEDNGPRLGAALAFYTILSISPLMILMVATISLILHHSNAQAHLLSLVQSLVGPQGKSAVAAILKSGEKTSSGVFATSVGVLTLLFGASGVFGELRSALNTIWETESKEEKGIAGMLRERLFSFCMVLSVGFILLVSLLASAAIDATTKFFRGLLPIPVLMLSTFNFCISLIGIALLFAIILKYVPETTVTWKDVRIGAIVTALLFTVGKSLLGLYLGKTTPGSAYGAAGSFVVMVLWVYYSSQIFYFGAEFTHVYAVFRKKRAGHSGLSHS